MSEQSIYQALRAGGLSPAGACGMLGNMYCESLLKSNNVEDRCTLGDFDYTNAVDSGTITRWQFMADAFGYGLCQWTYSSRKDHLYMFARDKGVSIGDEAMQCEFCLYELQSEHNDLYKYLSTTNDLPESAKRICAEFERPAVNNFADRINAAQRFYNELVGTECGDDSCPVPEILEPQLLLSVDVRMLQKGDLGRDVFLLQCGLMDMGYDCGLPDGDFGVNTEEAVKELQRANKLSPSGAADIPVWEIILKPR